MNSLHFQPEVLHLIWYDFIFIFCISSIFSALITCVVVVTVICIILVIYHCYWKNRLHYTSIPSSPESPGIPMTDISSVSSQATFLNPIYAPSPVSSVRSTDTTITVKSPETSLHSDNDDDEPIAKRTRSAKKKLFI